MIEVRAGSSEVRATATEELRRMLDERGVEWGNVRNDGSESEYLTEWQFDDNESRAIAVEWAVGGGLSVEIHRYGLTPEQAIEATLGPLTERAAKDSEKDSDGRGTCHDEGDPSDFCCSECGMRMFTDTGETYTMIDSLGNIIEQPNFCPNCGRMVVAE